MAKRKRTNNGLVLDFTLESVEERQDFVNKLVAEWQEAGRILRDVDLTLLADYVLYGKDKDGLSPVKRKEVEIDTRYSSYEKKQVTSLEYLMEQPSFDENTLHPITRRSPYKTSQVHKINRDEISQYPIFQEVWRNIDNLAAEIAFFEGKKELEDFSPEIQDHLRNLRAAPSQLSLYKKKHTLIEMRREQFTLRDHFIPTTFQRQPSSSYVEEDTTSIPWQELSDKYQIFPLGVFNKDDPVFTLFLDPKSYLANPAALSSRSFYLPDRTTPSQYSIDFTNPTHLYHLFKFYEELKIASLNDPDSTLSLILNTLDFYIKAAHLTKPTEEILFLKIHHYHNDFIASYINKKYGKKHTPNYISTIFKGRICADIAETAQLHYDTFMARDNPLAFKTCNHCGVTKLKDIRNFVRKSKSTDGLSSRCKECDRIEREELKRTNTKKPKS